jgi:hypothetical protein
LYLFILKGWLTRAAQYLDPHLAKSHSLLPETKSNSIHSCDICQSPLPESHLEIALCPNESCASLFHLTCLASRIEESDSILPVKGSCPGCQKEIWWGDVIRGVFGRSGRMESINIDEDHDMDDTEVDEDDQDLPVTPRKKRVSGLVRLTGKPKTPQKSTSKKSRAKKGKPHEVEIVPATDDDATPKPNTPRKPRGRPKKPKTVTQTTDTVNPDILQKTDYEKRSTNSMMIPDSSGEAKDVWVISSDDE